MFHRRAFLAALAALPLLAPVSRADDDAKKKDKPAEKKTVTLAHIRLSGSTAERAPSVDPLLGEVGETFKQKIDRIKKARDDKNVQGLFLEIDGISLGWGKLNELTGAIAHFRTSGKKVYAYVEGGAMREYLLAVSCDEVIVPESAMLMLTGLRAEISFYKGLFKKLGIEADFLQMGDFKAAAEGFTRDGLSENNRLQLNSMLDDFFEHEIVGRIVKGRSAKKLTDARVKELIDTAPLSARTALKAGLVDRLAYDEEFLRSLKSRYKADSLRVVRDYGKKKDDEVDMLALFRKLLWGGPAKGATSRGNKVAVIYATGAIMSGKSGSSLLGGETVGSETMVKAIRQAENDKSVKAIVLRVDSPGGSALASDVIWNELRRCKKPVVASMSDVAASGGYYISMAARKIYAEPGTITGSIGVVSGKLAMGGLWAKAGIKTEVLSRGANSGLLSTEAPFSPSERKAMKGLMEDIYDQFVDKAHKGRLAAGKKMSKDQLLKLAGGRIWTGRQAKENGLIDEVGTLDDAIAAAAKMAGMPADKEPELLFLPKPRNPLDALLGSALGGAEAGIKLDVLAQVPGLAAKLRGVDALLGLRNEPVWLVLPFRLEVK